MFVISHLRVTGEAYTVHTTLRLSLSWYDSPCQGDGITLSW